MGGFLVKESKAGLNKSTIKFLRGISLSNIFEWYEYFESKYAPESKLTKEEFDDIFSPILNDTEVFYHRFEVYDRADFYEALNAMTMFSKGEFNTKIKSLYNIYDVDGSGEIDKDELKVFLKSGILGLCRMLSLSIPLDNEITSFAYNCFKQMDTDRSGSIEYDEFEFWIRNSDEIQDFLLVYTGQQTMDRAQKRYNTLLEGYKEAFNAVCIEFMGENYATTDSLKK